MLKRLNKGFSIVETMISISIILLLSQMCLFVGYKNSINDKNKRIHYSAMQLKYNLLQIIKSDGYFYLHPELYFEDKNGYIETKNINKNYSIYLYFNDYNELTENGFHRLYAIISCNVFSYKTHNLLYYNILMKEKVINQVDKDIGGYNYFYKMEKN